MPAGLVKLHLRQAILQKQGDGAAHVGLRPVNVDRDACLRKTREGRNAHAHGDYGIDIQADHVINDATAADQVMIDVLGHLNLRAFAVLDGDDGEPRRMPEMATSQTAETFIGLAGDDNAHNFLLAFFFHAILAAQRHKRVTEHPSLLPLVSASLQAERLTMSNHAIGIIGMGMIGASTAVLSTLHGIRTIAYVRNPQKVDGCWADYDGMCLQLAEEGLVTAEQIAHAKTFLRIVSNYEELASCTFIFEAIAENAEAKWDCFRQIEANCPHVRAIGSCSSSILPDVLAQSTPALAEKILVTHPFFPVYLVPYVEMCPGTATSEDALAYTREVLAALDRKPSLLKKPNPGFIGNYLQFALWAAALKLVEDGVCDPADIDNCLAYSFCPRYTSIGIFEHFDHGGYQLNATTCDNVFPALPRYDGAPQIVREKAQSADAWGAKSPMKKGFYEWADVDPIAYGKRVSAPYLGFIDWQMPDADCSWD